MLGYAAGTPRGAPGGRRLLRTILRTIFEITLRVSADTWALDGQFGLVKYPQTMKNQEILIMDETLAHINLSHMDILDDPAAIH